MIGFIIAATLVVLRLLFDAAITENDILTAIIQASTFLFWWYLITGVLSLTIATIAWTGDLGSEGARMRVGIATSMAWMIGLYRMPVSSGWSVLYLAVRRCLLAVGAYCLVIGVQSTGGLGRPQFVIDELMLAAGALLLIAGLLLAFIKPHITREFPSVRFQEVSS